MDNPYPERKLLSQLDDETDALVDSWTLEELARGADLESVQSAWAHSGDVHAR